MLAARGAGEKERAAPALAASRRRSREGGARAHERSRARAGGPLVEVTFDTLATLVMFSAGAGVGPGLVHANWMLAVAVALSTVPFFIVYCPFAAAVMVMFWPGSLELTVYCNTPHVLAVLLYNTSPQLRVWFWYVTVTL